MPNIYVYNAAESQEREQPVFGQTLCVVGTTDEYQFYRAMDLLKGSHSTTKLFFFCEEDYMHYIAVRTTLDIGGNADAFGRKLASVRDSFPRTNWAPTFPRETRCGGTNRTNQSNQFPVKIRVFAA
tara:strand:- start:1629 stop:2006 length:378 start_codon:yes stop_codon:yes gene_type:complete